MNQVLNLGEALVRSDLADLDLRTTVSLKQTQMCK